jgi:hypothetical protein
MPAINFNGFCSYESSNIWHNININIEETEFEDMTWHHLNQKKIQCWGLVNMVINLWFPHKSGNLSTTRVTTASQELCPMQVIQKKAECSKLFSKFSCQTGVYWLMLSLDIWMTYYSGSQAIAISQWEKSMVQQSATVLATYNTTITSSLLI